MLRTDVGGDPVGGWLVDIHDGDNHGVYSPTAATAVEALTAALEMHRAKFNLPHPEPLSLASQMSDPGPLVGAGLTGANDGSTAPGPAQAKQADPAATLAANDATPPPDAPSAA